MKKALFALVIAGGLGATYVKAAPSHPTLNWGSHLNAASGVRASLRPCFEHFWG